MPDYGAPGAGMGQMIQMISALSEMQMRKRAQSLDEAKYKTQKEQFAQQMGVSLDDQQFKKVSKILDQINTGSTDAHVGAGELAKLLKLSPEEGQLFAHVAPSASAAQQMFSTAQQQAGLGSMSPGQQQTSQQNAYLANQANTSIGGQASGQLIAQLAGNGDPSGSFGSQFMRKMGEGYVARQATGQNPWEYAVGQAGIAGGMAPAAASVAAGLTPGANAITQAKSEDLRTAAEMDKAAMELNARMSAKMTPDGYTNLINSLRATTQAFADPKNASEASKKQLLQQYNSLARMAGLGTIQDDTQIPAAIGMVERLYKGMSGTNVPQPGPAPSAPFQMPAPQAPNSTNFAYPQMHF